jgi:hypothetical protein
MKPLIGSVLLLCACLPLAAGEAGEKGRAKSAAQAMADAFIKQDYEKFADAMYPRLLKQVGGREKVIAALKETAADMKSKGIKLQTYKVSDPTGISGKGDKRFAVLPYKMVMTGPKVKSSWRSH